MSDDFEYISHARLEYRDGCRHAYLGEVAKPPHPFAQPPGNTYALDQAKFEEDHDASTGLGSVFNARACVDCPRIL
jgi:hypothetical protein